MPWSPIGKIIPFERESAPSLPIDGRLSARFCRVEVRNHARWAYRGLISATTTSSTCMFRDPVRLQPPASRTHVTPEMADYARCAWWSIDHDRGARAALAYGAPLVSKIMHLEDQVKSESRGAVHVNACRGLMRRVLQTCMFFCCMFFSSHVRRPKSKKVLRSEVTLPPSVNKTIDSRLDGGKHFESNCTCWQGQTAADCEKETISRRSSSTVCTHSNSVVTGDRVGTPCWRHTT